MSHSEDHFREILGSKLATAEMDAPGITWADFSKSRKRRTFVFWWWRVAGIAFLAVATMLFFKLPDFETTTEQDRTGQYPTAPANSGIISEKENTSSAELSGSDQAMKWRSSKLSVLKIPEKTEVTEFIGPELPQSPEVNEHRYAGLDIYGLGISIMEQKYSLHKGAMIPEPVLYDFRELKGKFKDGLYWKLQAGAALNMPQFSVTNAGKAFIHKDYEGIRKNSEHGVAGYGFQAGLAKVRGRWMFSAGLGYSLSEIRGQYDFLYSEKPVIDVDGRIVNYATSAPVKINFGSRQKITFAEIPVAIQYRFWQKNELALGTQLAFIPQFLNSISGELPNSVLLDHKESMSNVNYKGMASVFEFGLPVYKSIDLRSKLSVMPFYRLHMGLDQVQSLYNTRLNNWGLNCSYLMAF